MKAADYEVCIIGLGPAGLGAALHLARSSIISKVICLEAGIDVSHKFCSVLQGKGCRHVQPCQIITGVGGSSVLSGGKISTFPAGRGMSHIIGGEELTRQSLNEALELLRGFVSLIPPEFSTKVQDAQEQYNNLGFEFRYYDAYLYQQSNLINGYKAMLNEIVNTGTSVHLDTKVTNITAVSDGFRIHAIHGGNEVMISSEKIIVATGRYGRELVESINYSLDLDAKPNDCDVGIRLEFPTSIWPNINYCHNDLKLHFGRARTFCVCKDGFLAPYRLGNIFLLEGSDDPYVSTGFTNLAITIRLSSNSTINRRSLFSDIEHRMLSQSRGLPIREKLLDFLQNKRVYPDRKKKNDSPSSISFWKWGNVNACFPPLVASSIRERVGYFVSRLFPADAYSSISVFAPELDHFWPQFPVSHGFSSKKSGMYLIGDCSGHFRGILQAFCSGLECGKHISGLSYV